MDRQILAEVTRNDESERRLVEKTVGTSAFGETAGYGGIM
jgi:hypothetical protein